MITTKNVTRRKTIAEKVFVEENNKNKNRHANNTAINNNTISLKPVGIFLFSHVGIIGICLRLRGLNNSHCCSQWVTSAVVRFIDVVVAHHEENGENSLLSTITSSSHQD